MFVYTEITGFSESVISMDFNIEDAHSGFLVAAGSGIGTNDRLDYSGIIFSGYEGYIFDQSGDFVGGYEANSTFNITSHIHTGNNYSYASYFIDGVLIKNDYGPLTKVPMRIEFDKHGESSLRITHFASTDNQVS